MSDPKTQPTVLVKRADGTFVRMSLDEVKKIKIQPGAVKKVVASKPLPPPQQVNDFSVPLEEMKAKGKVKNAPKLSPSRDGETEAVMKRLRISVPKENTNRLRTIIQLRLTDVRSVDQTKDALMRRVLDGGLGFSALQAEEVFRECDAVIQPAASTEEVATIKELKQEAKSALTPELYQEPRLPAVATPHNPFIHDKLPPASVARSSDTPFEGGSRGMLGSVGQPTPVLRDIPARAGNTNIPRAPLKGGTTGSPTPNLPIEKEITKAPKNTPTSNLRAAPAVKPTMHDVMPPSGEIGPIEELKYITLADFRHIAPTPEEAASRLKQKLFNLRDESILVYLQGLEAWRQSPLYKDYMALVSQALADGIGLEAAVRTKESLSASEFKALVGMSHGLKV